MTPCDRVLVSGFWLRWILWESTWKSTAETLFYPQLPWLHWLLHLKLKSALRVTELILNLHLKATLPRKSVAVGRSCSQPCWSTTVSIHFLYAAAKRFCSWLQQLSRTPLTKLYSEVREGGSGRGAPLFSRLLSRGSGRDIPSTSIASPARCCPFTWLWGATACRSESLMVYAVSASPLQLQWCWRSLLQRCHR